MKRSAEEVDDERALAAAAPATIAYADVPTQKKRSRRNRAALMEAAREKAKQEHAYYVEKNYPRLAPDERPILVPLDADSLAVLAPPSAAFRALPEITFNCTGYTPFVGDAGLIDPVDLPFLEQVNAKNWGYRDACTGIVVAKGSASTPLLADSLRALAVARGGKPFNVPPDVLLCLPDWMTVAYSGTVSVSLGRRSIEFSVTFDEALRKLIATDMPMGRLRSSDFHSRYADFRIYARYSDGSVGQRVLEACAIAVHGPPPPGPSPTADDDDDDGESMGAAVRMRAEYTQVPAAAFFSAVHNSRPTRWYAVLLSNPRLLCTADDDCLIRGLMASVPRRDEDEGGGDDGEMVDVSDDFMTVGYASRPAAPARDELSRTTLGVIRDLSAVGSVDPRDFDAWVATKGDCALSTLAIALLKELVMPDGTVVADVVDGRNAVAEAYAALVALRLLRRAWDLRDDPDEADPDAEDALSAFRMLRSAPASPVLRDLLHFVFCSVARENVRKACS